MAFPLCGGLVETCHTAAENTHLYLVCLHGKSCQSCLFFNFCQHLNSIDYCCNGFIHSFNEQ